jgi:hypothetical protein
LDASSPSKRRLRGHSQGSEDQAKNRSAIGARANSSGDVVKTIAVHTEAPFHWKCTSCLPLVTDQIVHTSPEKDSKSDSETA